MWFFQNPILPAVPRVAILMTSSMNSSVRSALHPIVYDFIIFLRLIVYYPEDLAKNVYANVLAEVVTSLQNRAFVIPKNSLYSKNNYYYLCLLFDEICPHFLFRRDY